MRENSINIYQIARNQSGLTQENAAELLSVGVRTLSDYENGKYKVPDDVVIAMTEKYPAPWLPIMHLKNVAPGIDLDSVKMKGLSGSTICFQSSLGHIEDILRELIEVVRDDEITENEMPQVQRIESELLVLLTSTLNLIISIGAKKLTGGLL